MAITQFVMTRPSKGQQWNVLPAVGDDLEWTTDMNFTAGELTFTLIDQDGSYNPAFGDTVSFSWDGVKVFYGFVFKVSYEHNRNIKVTALDKMRYLKSQDTLVFCHNSLVDRFNTICDIAGISHKVLAGTGYTLPAVLYDGKTYFDMLQEDIKTVRKATGDRFFIRDVYGRVELTKTELHETNLLIGDQSAGHDWTFEKSIDDAYNVVKVVQTKDDSIVNQVTEQGATVSVWGRLQKVESADEELNTAQMRQQALESLRESERASRTLTLSDVQGSLDLRAGSSFWLFFENLARFGIKKRLVLATKVTHKFSHSWTMTIEVEV